jgi:hypothetical protein
MPGVSSKKRKGNRSRKKASKERRIKPRTVRQGLDLEALWDERRAGARNIAGVTYQVAVTAQLLVAGRSGRLPIRAVTPEGLEDIDCELAPGWRTSNLFVQCKERAAGESSLGMADLADFLAHSLEAAQDSESHMALVTDASFGSDLAETGWDKTALDVLDTDARDRLREFLPDVGDIDQILGRSHLVRLPFDLVGEVSLLLAEQFDVKPVVAGLAMGQLLQDLVGVAAGQRSRSAAAPMRRTVDDLTPLMADVVRVVDASQLMTAEFERIVTPLDFLRPLDISSEDFLAGVDVRPGHIAANLDFPRPSELGQISDGLRERGIVLIVGPSGAGKSSLLWRTAENFSGLLRPFRLGTCRQEDVAKVLDYVDLLSPSKSAPVLVCADDLGREHMAGWEELASALLERPGVNLLGAAREEDFQPSFAVRRASLVRPRLDRQVAGGIDEILKERGVSRALSVDEAFERSRELLMEFLTLLTTGERLSTVVGEQVHALLKPERDIEREVLRYICATHVLGTSLPAAALPALVGAANLGEALDRLAHEHFILEETGDSWRGLHELRSEVVTQSLHATPPPDLMATWCRLVRALPQEVRPLLAPRIARLTELDLAQLAVSIGGLIAEPETDSEQATKLVLSLKEAESVRHAAGCLEVIRSFGPPKMDMVDLLRVLACKRFRGIDLLAATGKPIDPTFYRMADSLPDRPDFREPVLSGLSPSHVVTRATSGTTADAISLLQAFERTSFRLDDSDADAILAAHASARSRDKASLAATLIGNGATPEAIGRSLDDVPTRLQALIDEEVTLRDWETTDAADGKIVTASIVMIPQPDTDPNEDAVGMARLILDLCPEAEFAEVVTFGLDGERFKQGDVEPGYKRLSRDAVPRTPETEEMKGLLSAAHELVASRYWTERLREQADLFATLRPLLEEIPQRLLDPRDSGRKRWISNVDQFRTRVAALPTAPLSEALGARASESERRRQDPSREVLQLASMALAQIAAEMDDLPAHRLRGIAVQLRRVSQEMGRAYEVGTPILADVGDPLPSDIGRVAGVAADILINLSDSDPIEDLPSRGGRNIWIEFGKALLERYQVPAVDQERQAIEASMAAANIPGQVALTTLFESDSPTPNMINGQWIVKVDFEHWDSGTFLDSISGQTRQGLARRVVALPVFQGMALPAGAALLTSRDVTGLSSDRIAEAAKLVDLDVHLPELYKSIVEALPSLLRASAWAAASRVGQPSNVDQELKARSTQLVEEARGLLEGFGGTEAKEVWEDLCGAVAAEVEGRSDESLSRETATVARGGPPGPLVQMMQRAIFLAVLVAPD